MGSGMKRTLGSRDLVVVGISVSVIAYVFVVETAAYLRRDLLRPAERQVLDEVYAYIQCTSRLPTIEQLSTEVREIIATPNGITYSRDRGFQRDFDVPRPLNGSPRQHWSAGLLEPREVMVYGSQQRPDSLVYNAAIYAGAPVEEANRAREEFAARAILPDEPEAEDPK